MKNNFCLRGLWFFALAFCAFQAAAQNRPDALAEYRQGNYQRAVEICQLEITESPDNLDSHVVICWSLLRLNRYNEALRYAQAGRALNRYDPRIVEILGEVNYYLGRNVDALQYFQEYINLNPEGQRIESAYFFIGEIFIRQGKFRHADIALTTAVHWMPGNAAWWARLAYARENAGDFQEAVGAYERALALNPQLGDAHRGLERTRQALAGRP
jgi:tetratricopeptide (TPR) repeat protein